MRRRHFLALARGRWSCHNWSGRMGRIGSVAPPVAKGLGSLQCNKFEEQDRSAKLNRGGCHELDQPSDHVPRDRRS
jgi:hypothetical protein